MTLLLFPDTTVFVNFSLIERMDLLQDLLSGKGYWTLTIAGECGKSSRIAGLEQMRRAADFMNVAIIPTRAERMATDLIKAQLSSPEDRPSDHLGEAEAFAVITARSLPATFVTDDVRAARLARTFSLHTLSTAEVLKLAVRSHRLSAEEAWRYVEQLHRRSRTLPHCPLTLGQFRAWVAN